MGYLGWSLFQIHPNADEEWYECYSSLGVCYHREFRKNAVLVTKNVLRGLKELSQISLIWGKA